MLSITPSELQSRLSKNEDIVLVDVREGYEHDEYNIGGLHIPLAQLMEMAGKIPQDKKVVIYCQKGIRSQIAIQRLQQKFPYQNLINLTGGMKAWKHSIEGRSI